MILDSKAAELILNPNQEEAHEAFAAAAEEEESEPEEQPEAVEEDADSEDTWGVHQESEKPKPQAKRSTRKPKAKSEPKETVPDKLEKEKAGGTTPKISAAIPKNLDKLVAQSTSMCQVFQQMNPLLVWHNVAKTKEWEAKTDKAFALIDALEAAEQTEAVKKVCHSLKVHVNDTGLWCSLVHTLKQSNLVDSADVHDFMNWVAEDHKKICKLLGKQSPECLKVVLTEFGRLFAEARSVFSQIIIESCVHSAFSF